MKFIVLSSLLIALSSKAGNGLLLVTGTPGASQPSSAQATRCEFAKPLEKYSTCGRPIPIPLGTAVGVPEGTYVLHFGSLLYSGILTVKEGAKTEVALTSYPIRFEKKFNVLRDDHPENPHFSRARGLYFLMSIDAHSVLYYCWKNYENKFHRPELCQAIIDLNLPEIGKAVSWRVEFTVVDWTERECLRDVSCDKNSIALFPGRYWIKTWNGGSLPVVIEDR